MKIQELTLHTRSIAQIREFYAVTLAFPVLAEETQCITFATGSTRLTFVQDRDFDGFYHVAFDIPRNRVQGARAWLEARMPLLADEQGEIQFRMQSWNSTNLYFDDPAGNIMEFTARHDLEHDSETPFDGVSHVSELGVVVPDVPAAVHDMGERYGLRPFNGQSDTFTAVGGHDGMLIVVKAGRGWFPVSRPAVPAPFQLLFHSGTMSRVLDSSALGGRS